MILCDPCARVSRVCVPCVPRLPLVSFYGSQVKFRLDWT